jgi:hypothetical protein
VVPQEVVDLAADALGKSGTHLADTRPTLVSSPSISVATISAPKSRDPSGMNPITTAAIVSHRLILSQQSLRLPGKYRLSKRLAITPSSPRSTAALKYAVPCSGHDPHEVSIGRSEVKLAMDLPTA